MIRAFTPGYTRSINRFGSASEIKTKSLVRDKTVLPVAELARIYHLK